MSPDCLAPSQHSLAAPRVSVGSAGPLRPTPHCLPGEELSFGELPAAPPRAPKASEPLAHLSQPALGQTGHQGPLGPAPAPTLLLGSLSARRGDHPTSHPRSGAGHHSHICHCPQPPCPGRAPRALSVTTGICHLLLNLPDSFSVLVIPSPHPRVTSPPPPSTRCSRPKGG